MQLGAIGVITRHVRDRVALEPKHEVGLVQEAMIVRDRRHKQWIAIQGHHAVSSLGLPCYCNCRGRGIIDRWAGKEI